MDPLLETAAAQPLGRIGRGTPRWCFEDSGSQMLAVIAGHAHVELRAENMR